MEIKSNISTDTNQVTYTKLQDYGMLVKVRLSLTVVFTSVLGFIISANCNVNFTRLMLLAVGGFLVTAGANALNEVLEKDYDALMKRTSVRPLATGRMKTSDAVLFAGITCLIGVALLGMINPLTSLLGMLSFVLYAFVYTPLKRVSTIAVAIGAIPGALPVLIGCTANEGSFTSLSVGLFAVQFLWQFPHFWAIGYLAFDDYKNAGYKLLPESSDGNIDRNIGLYSLIYTLLIVPVMIALFYFGDMTLIAFCIGMLLTIMYGYFSLKFHVVPERKTGLALMFSSFFYMPLFLLTLIFI